MRLRAAEDGTAIDLTLGSAKPVVLQGERGLSRKGPEPGNASYYYSLTRMPARGTVRLAGLTLAVEGLAWMDREWSTSALGKHLAGWDWFALQLDDGRDMMFYQLRGRDGGIDRWSGGALVDPRGGARPLARDDVRIEVLATWRSPRSGVDLPRSLASHGRRARPRGRADAADRRSGVDRGTALLGGRGPRAGPGRQPRVRGSRLRRAGGLWRSLEPDALRQAPGASD